MVIERVVLCKNSYGSVESVESVEGVKVWMWDNLFYQAFGFKLWADLGTSLYPNPTYDAKLKFLSVHFCKPPKILILYSFSRIEFVTPCVLVK